MAISNAVKKTPAESNAKPKGKTALAGHADRAGTLRLYVKDKTLIKKVKMAALEDDTSLSQLWEDWATEWLKSR
ncbi:hypothetical protein [Corynebacterium tapiri]|uniref:Uncharacterized protein n=1 Tax=Corynebacterium tapiri TaxID=1448266 RepID=A0A5C4U2B5_9CORY|nr:hypothetical protein [Corynebacterium tapiri]TNL94603.1 hypothetical protein FHE74_10315 [Corynebacterium tapiri]